MIWLTVFASIYVLLQVVHTARFPDNDKVIWEDLIAPYKPACVEEESGNHDDIVNMFDHGHILETETVACYLKCLYVKLDILKPDGSFNVDHLSHIKIEYMSPQLWAKCSKEAVSETDICKKSFILGNCIVKDVSV